MQDGEGWPGWVRALGDWLMGTRQAAIAVLTGLNDEQLRWCERAVTTAGEETTGAEFYVRVRP